MSKRLLTKLSIALGLATALGLGACDKVKDIVNPNQDTKASTQEAAKTSSSSTKSAETPLTVDITSEEVYGPTNYLSLPTELLIPTVYLENNIGKLDSYNLVSSSYKNYLMTIANFKKTPRSIDLENQLYISLYNVKDVPKSEVVIFYIDTMRHLHKRLSRGLNEIAYTNGINKDKSMYDLNNGQKVQFLSDLKDGLNQATDNFFAENQFIGQQRFGLTQEQNTEEYQRYLNVTRELKNQNEALIQYDNTCVNNYKKAGDVINCLQQKLTVAYAALDTQLLSTLKVYLATNKNKIPVDLLNQNIKQLDENLPVVIEFYKQRFAEDAAKLPN